MRKTLPNEPKRPGALTARVGSWLLEKVAARRLKAPLHGALTVHFPDGRIRSFGDPETGEHAILTLYNFSVLRQVMRRGTVGFASAYMNGGVEAEDLTAVFRFFIQNQSVFDSTSPGVIRRTAHDLAYHFARSNTREGSRKNISEHYDLGNEFYAEWLDPSMTYSSALFSGPDQSLEDAQRAKYHRVADMAGIRSGETVLEIGCGWGGFAEVMARDYDASLYGITLSAEQLKYATERLHRQGLDNRAALHFEDYRDTTGLYDHVCSIEMIEAVGEEHWPAYFQTVRDRLKPGGTAAIQAITIDETDLDIYRNGVDFIQRYIFPGGMLLAKSIMREQGERVGLILENVENFRLSYARTLKLWRDRFIERWPVIAKLGYDEEFRRKWFYYLSYCEAGFTEGTIDVGIYQYKRPEQER